MDKKRILFHTEAPWTSSGFGVYSNNILSRLHKTGKYTIAEFANYGTVNNSQDKTEWSFYANMPSNPQQQQEYNANAANQFGLWRFERVLVDFKPDIVISYLDPWMMNYQSASPLRKFFHYVQMPTCDSAPQKAEWMSQFSEADGLLGYNDWAVKVLRKQSNKNVFGSAPPGIDTDIFSPFPDKKQVRTVMGLPSDANIIGTVMRNQGRKLFPDLFCAFRKFLDLCEKKDQHGIAQKTFLLCHTSYPDMGWLLPQFLKEHGIYNKVYFTYVCRSCSHVCFKFFQDAKTYCPKCHKLEMTLTNVGNGIPHNELAHIYRTMDIYMQYSICEGMGMPQIEAASCGIPIMSTNYSAMEDVIPKLGGISVKVQKLFMELETHAYRAYPDNDDCAEKWYQFFTCPEYQRKKYAEDARKGVEKYYTWDRTAKIWESYFDGVELKDLQGKWNSPYNLIQPDEMFHDELLKNVNALTNWLITRVLCQPELLNTYFHMLLNQQMNHLAQINIRQVNPITPQQMHQALLNRVKMSMFWESVRCDKIKLPTEDYLEYAKLKGEIYA